MAAPEHTGSLTEFCERWPNSHHEFRCLGARLSGYRDREPEPPHLEMEREYRQKIDPRIGMNLRTPSQLSFTMRVRATAASEETGWVPTNDPEGRYSSGIPDLDRLIGGGFRRGSETLFTLDETVDLEDLDLILFPIFLNFLYQSRGIIAVLPSRDSPHAFRGRLTRYATRRRFDTRVRVVDYFGEDHGLSYVVNLAKEGEPIPRQRAIQKMVAAEKEAQGGHKKPIIEYTAFEAFETGMGAEAALKSTSYGIKRVKIVGNLGIGLLRPGLGMSAGVRSAADAEFALHRDDVGLIIRGVRPSFPSFVVTADRVKGLPYVSFVPQPK